MHCTASVRPLISPLNCPGLFSPMRFEIWGEHCGLMVSSISAPPSPSHLNNSILHSKIQLPDSATRMDRLGDSSLKEHLPTSARFAACALPVSLVRTLPGLFRSILETIRSASAVWKSAILPHHSLYHPTSRWSIFPVSLPHPNNPPL